MVLVDWRKRHGAADKTLEDSGVWANFRSVQQCA